MVHKYMSMAVFRPDIFLTLPDAGEHKQVLLLVERWAGPGWRPTQYLAIITCPPPGDPDDPP